MNSVDRALALWRSRPTATHAALIRRAAALVRRELVEPHEWLDIEARHDADDIDRLLAALLDGDERGYQARLERLASRPADPRIVDAMVAIIELEPRPLSSPVYQPFWTSVLAIVRAHGDSRIVPRLRAACARAAPNPLWHAPATRLAEVIDALAARNAPDDVDSPVSLALVEDLARMEASRRAYENTTLALFDAVWAEPDDDAPRFVLADFLNEHAEPRGEFIALQFAHRAGKLSAAGRKREKKLLSRHKSEWVGPIAPLVHAHEARFERGFVVGCHLASNVELEIRLGDHPAWSTIREYMVDAPRRISSRLAHLLRAHGARKVDVLVRGID